jgi:uncharacterized protein YjiS (DUF1127 family)
MAHSSRIAEFAPTAHREVPSLTKRIKAHVDKMMTIRTLRELDDRTLADLGVLRHEIPDAVRNGREH